MNESIGEIQQLLQQAAALLKSGSKPDLRQAGNKMKRIAALASTIALTIDGQRH